MCHIPDLDVLYLDQKDGKKISWLPDDIEHLRVSELHLGHNSLASLPERMANMSRIASIYLNNNQLKSIPAALCYLKQIKVNTDSIGEHHFTSLCIVETSMITH